MNSEPHASARPVARARFAALLTPRRAALLNLALAALLILLADTPAITAAIGGGALFFAAVTGLRAAARLSAGATALVAPETLSPWLTGLFAIVLAALGLGLAVSSPGDRLLQGAGIFLFLLQVTLIVCLDPQPDAEARSARRTGAGGR